MALRRHSPWCPQDAFLRRAADCMEKPQMGYASPPLHPPAPLAVPGDPGARSLGCLQRQGQSVGTPLPQPRPRTRIAARRHQAEASSGMWQRTVPQRDEDLRSARDPTPTPCQPQNPTIFQTYPHFPGSIIQHHPRTVHTRSYP